MKGLSKETYNPLLADEEGNVRGREACGCLALACCPQQPREVIVKGIFLEGYALRPYYGTVAPRRRSMVMCTAPMRISSQSAAYCSESALHGKLA